LRNRIGLRILHKAAALDVESFENAETYDALRNAYNEIGSRPLGVVGKVIGVGQALIALVLIVIGAQIFVDAVEHAAGSAGLPAGLVALVLAPLATELPEKINSVIWVRDGKDTLALGNITGAMVFQSTVPVTFGVLFTRWELEPLSFFSVVLALVSAGFVYFELRRRKTLQAWQLMLGGLFYLVFLAGAVVAVT
jgi:cation:H+ antiporter